MCGRCTADFRAFSLCHLVDSFLVLRVGRGARGGDLPWFPGKPLDSSLSILRGPPCLTGPSATLLAKAPISSRRVAPSLAAPDARPSPHGRDAWQRPTTWSNVVSPTCVSLAGMAASRVPTSSAASGAACWRSWWGQVRPWRARTVAWWGRGQDKGSRRDLAGLWRGGKGLAQPEVGTPLDGSRSHLSRW